ncbi:MAG: hypothetical protein OZ948_13390 [Deltaproteobacteria bacterium]|nr:hypothetical protein [Deltaproteobacteria bacterium]
MRRPLLRPFVLVTLLLAAAPAAAQRAIEWSAPLPFTGGQGQTHGDLVAHAGGVTAFYSRPDLGGLRLFLYRWGTDGALLLAREVGDPAEIYYEPGACWDGARYAVAASSYTRGHFLVLDAAGDALLPTMALPGIPFGGRTAAFRVRCTPLGYAVFALLLEPEFEGSPYYYTRLHYWLLDATGAAAVERDLGILLSPISYPGFEGLEKEYYDVAWTGNGFLVAYSAECGAPASFQACYRVVDAAGETVRAEAPLTTVPTQGPHLASHGAVVGAATLLEVPFPSPSNTPYARFFDADGTPRGPEQPYSDPALFPLGYAPALVSTRDGFLAAYVQPNPFTLAYEVMLAPFTPLGAQLGYGAAVADPANLVPDTVNLGIDFQLAAQGTRLYGKGQAGIVQVAPIVFGIPEPGVNALAATAFLALAAAARRGIVRPWTSRRS